MKENHHLSGAPGYTTLTVRPLGESCQNSPTPITTSNVICDQALGRRIAWLQVTSNSNADSNSNLQFSILNRIVILVVVHCLLNFNIRFKFVIIHYHTQKLIKGSKTTTSIQYSRWMMVIRCTTGSPESQQHTGSQIIRICMEIYLKIDKTVKMYKNSYLSIHTS